MNSLLRIIILIILSFCQLDAQDLGWAISHGGVFEDYGYQVIYSPDQSIIVNGEVTNCDDFDPGTGVLPVNGRGNFIAKYSPSGELLWVHFFDFISTTYIDVDQDGNIYYAGLIGTTGDFDPGVGTTILTANKYSDCFVAKYSPDGTFFWVNHIEGDMSEVISTIRVDKHNDVVIAGRFKGVIDFDPGLDTFLLTSSYNGTSIFILKVDPDGQLIFAGKMQGVFQAEIRALDIDSANNIYGIGTYDYEIDVDLGPDTFLLDDQASPANEFFFKFDPDGGLIWAKDFAFTGDRAVLADLAVTSAGHAWITGSFSGEVDIDPGPGVHTLTSDGSLTDIHFLHFDELGNLLDAYQMGGTGADKGITILVDDKDQVYIAGVYQNTVDFDPGVGSNSVTAINGSDMFITRFRMDGQLDWVASMGGLKSEDPRDLALDQDGNLYFTGGFNGTVDFDPGSGEYLITSKPGVGTGADYFLMQIIGDGVSATQDPAYSAVQIMPNPVYSEFQIIGISDLQRVKIYSQQGQEVYQGQSHQISLQGFHSGIYYIVIQASQHQSIHKIMKL